MFPFLLRRVDMPSKQTGEIDRFLAVRNTLLPDLPA